MSTPVRKLKSASNLSDVASAATARGNLGAAALAANTFTGLQEFSGTTHAGIKLISLTTAQRNALTAANGMLIYNTTTATVQKYEAGAWADVGAGGGAPSAHATSHQNGGSDEISVAGLSGLLADGQTPLAHASSHASGGSDAVKLDDLATPDDNTDLNASTTRHGLLKKLSNVSTEYMDGTGAWSVPAGGGAALELYAENPVAETTPVASGNNAVAIGNAATANNVDAIAIGYASVASGELSVAFPGGTASGNSSFAKGGTASGTNSSASGEGALADKYGQKSHAAQSFSVVGDAQTSLLVGRKSTSDATPAIIFLNTALSARLTLSNNTTWAFKILVVARRTDADGENDAWEITGLIHRDANAASTTLDASQINQIGATAWTCAVSADTTNGALQIDVTGAASKTIQWVARIETTETTG